MVFSDRLLNKPKYQPGGSTASSNYGVGGNLNNAMGFGGGGLGGGVSGGGSLASFGAQQSNYLGSNNAGGGLGSKPLPQLGGYKPSVLGNVGNNNNISTSSSAGTSGYLPPTGAGAGSRFGRLAQFGVMSGAGSNNGSNSNNGSLASNNLNDNSGSVGNSFASALGFGRHKI